MKNTVYLITAAAMAVIPVTTYGWVRSYGFEGVDAGLQVQQVSDGYLVFANAHLEELSDMWLLKTDPEGDTVWTHLFGMGGHEWGIAAFITSEKDFLIFSGNNYPGIMIMCTDSTGQVLWSRDYLDRLLTSA